MPQSGHIGRYVNSNPLLTPRRGAIGASLVVNKTRGHFPSDEAATKLLYLALRNISKKWNMPPRILNEAANQFAIMFGQRFTQQV
mgnify:CR=1 FL=1